MLGSVRADPVDSALFSCPGLGMSKRELLEPVSGMAMELWRPSQGIVPPDQRLFFSVWWAFHRLGVFRNGTYGVLMAMQGDRVVHRSCLMPAWYRWPYMAAGDVQVSNTWTHPEYQGQGIAAGVLRRVIRATHPTRTVWYSAHLDNAASIAVARRAGMRESGTAMRTQVMGLRVLGQYVKKSDVNEWSHVPNASR